MNTFLLFCFTALCFSPVPIFFLGCFFWYIDRYQENKQPPTLAAKKRKQLLEALED